ncbi:MAG: DNA mismatch endonuclease Vsr [Nitrospinota bacterium]
MDKIPPQKRAKNMRAIRSKGMKPEMIVRSITHRMGFRYRLHRSDLPGKPDLVFPDRRKAIFVHGCFWHQHTAKTCKITRIPKSNLEYWIPKLERNNARDKKNRSALRKLGWDVLIVWECQLKN